MITLSTLVMNWLSGLPISGIDPRSDDTASTLSLPDGVEQKVPGPPSIIRACGKLLRQCDACNSRIKEGHMLNLLAEHQRIRKRYPGTSIMSAKEYLDTFTLLRRLYTLMATVFVS
ncbi:uncharacterized protein ZBIST_4366 [Zygosaccharomyces bailii]|nr:uncharacterized protein ZBIST_4366 [Zygosaccharomyces bailii]